MSQRFYFFLWGVKCESVFADSVLLSWIQFRMCAILLYCNLLLLGITRENLCVDTIFYIVCLMFLSLSHHLSVSILMNVCVQSVAALHLMAQDKFPSGDNKSYLNPDNSFNKPLLQCNITSLFNGWHLKFLSSHLFSSEPPVKQHYTNDYVKKKTTL